jgi:type III secretion protein R
MNTPNPIVLVIVLGALALAPFVLIMMTSFVKISVSLSILRNALGTQQVPPSQVITGLSFVLTLFVMAPVVERMYNAAGTFQNTRDIFSEASVKSLFDAADKGKEPLRRFLAGHAHPKDRTLFMELAARLDQPAPSGTPSVVLAAPPDQAAPTPPPAPPPAPVINKDDFRVLIPSFVTSELKNAFQIGFLIFVPFLIIDMVVANILLSMGMTMLSPSVISLPFKLLLFVLVDGWYLVVRGLVLSYA